MTYEYRCIKCDRRFEVIKSVRDIDVNEFCPRCEAPGERQFVPSRVYFNKTAVTHAEYNPGLGCVVKNKAHLEDLCKQKDVVQVGNDFTSGEKMDQKFEKDREEKRQKSWDDIDKGWIGNGE